MTVEHCNTVAIYDIITHTKQEIKSKQNVHYFSNVRKFTSFYYTASTFLVVFNLLQLRSELFVEILFYESSQHACIGVSYV